MSSSVANWLKLNKLLDQYSRDGRDIAVTISYNIRWDSILLDTFNSSNNTAIHYAAIALPKVLSFPSALVIFASLEKSSLLLRGFLQSFYRELRNSGEVSDEVNTCNQHLTLHYYKLQASSPNVRRVCSVFCDNLLEISVLILRQCTSVDIDCSGVRRIMVSALFHTSLLEDYTNLFRKKLRKTEHVQKLFSVLKSFGDSADPLLLESYYEFLPELVSDFLNKFNEFQTGCKQFSILAFDQFILGLKIDQPQMAEYKLECLSLIIEKLESHLRVFPNDTDIFSAETETFSGILSVLMEMYGIHPNSTSRCMASIQKINHLLLEANLVDIFRLSFDCGVHSTLLLNSVFEIYSKLNQLDKLVQIIIEAAGELSITPRQSMVELKNVTQKSFAMSSLNTCNKCVRLLLTAVEASCSQTNPGLTILCEILSYILSVSPIGDLNATSSQRNMFLQLLAQLHSLIQTYHTITNSSSFVHTVSYLIILDSFIFSVFVVSQLPLWEGSSLSSLETIDWAGEWEDIASKFDTELLKRMCEIQIKTLITLSRFSQSQIRVTPFSPSCAQEFLSRAVERNLTLQSRHTILPSLLQYSSLFSDKLSHRAMLSISEQLVGLDTNNSNDTELRNILFSTQFRELQLIHPYLSYTIMIQIIERIDTHNPHQLATKINTELYSKLMNKLDRNLKGNIDIIDTNSIIREIETLLTSNYESTVSTECCEEITNLLNKFEIIPLSCIPIQLKLNLFLGVEVLLVLLAADKGLTELILSYCVTLLRAINRIPKQRKREVLAYLITLESLARYIYRVAVGNSSTTGICYEVFSEICLFLFEKNVEQFVSLTDYTIQLWHPVPEVNIQIQDLQLDLTYSVINSSTRRPEESVAIIAALNELVQTTTPILLKSLNNVQGVRGKAVRILSVNLTYIIVSRKSEQTQQTEEAINTIIKQVLKLIQNNMICDVTALESLISIADTLKQHNYSVDVKISRLLNQITQDLEWEVLVSEYNKNFSSGAQGSKLPHLNRKYLVGWVGCSDVGNFRIFLGEIIDRIDTEFVSSCHILCSVIEGNIPDTHRSEIRKLFQNILSKLTGYLLSLERELDRKEALMALRLVTAVFKLPSQIGVSSRSVVEGLTCITLVPLLSFVDRTDTLLHLFQTKSSSLHYVLRNYPDCAISCIPSFLLLTKEIIKCVFTLNNNTEFPILTRVLESYTSLPPLSNYTHHLIQQYIVTAQEWAEKQEIKNTLKPSIFALIGFSKPETLLSLQAQLDTNGRTFYKEMRDEFEKFYRFKGRT